MLLQHDLVHTVVPPGRPAIAAVPQAATGPWPTTADLLTRYTGQSDGVCPTQHLRHSGIKCGDEPLEDRPVAPVPGADFVLSTLVLCSVEKTNESSVHVSAQLIAILHVVLEQAPRFRVAVVAIAEKPMRELVDHLMEQR